MQQSQIEQLVARLTPEESRDGLWLVETFERWGSMSPDEAAGWRRLILARQRFLGLGDEPADSSVQDK